MTLRLFMIAGEASGDRLGADLIRSIRQKPGAPLIEVTGVAGPQMQAEGATSLFPMEELSIMGLAEILPRVPAMLRRIDQTAKAAIDWRADAVVTIDAPDFSFRVAKWLKRAGVGPLIHYVAPTVWAWRPGRARKLAALYDRLLCLLPFEPGWFQPVGLTADFVGHPVVSERAETVPRGDDILLLPGSRRGEVTRLLPVFAAAIKALPADAREGRVIVPTLPHLAPSVSAILGQSGLPATILTDPAGKAESFRRAAVALAASGTVSLELAAAGTPHLIAYKVHPVTAWLARRLLTVDSVTLINLLLDQALVPEFLQQDCRAEALSGALATLLVEETSRARQIAGFSEALDALTAPEGAAAKAVLSAISHVR